MMKKFNFDTIEQSKKYKYLKESLLDQLKKEGKDTPQNVDLVGTYMSFWETGERIKSDIKERGVTVATYNAKGNCTMKKNDNVAELVKVNGQMLRILETLDLKTTTLEVDDEL